MMMWIYCVLNVPLINRYVDILDLAPLFALIDYHHNVKSTLTTHDCDGLSMNVSVYVICVVNCNVDASISPNMHPIQLLD